MGTSMLRTLGLAQVLPVCWDTALPLLMSTMARQVRLRASCSNNSDCCTLSLMHPFLHVRWNDRSAGAM